MRRRAFLSLLTTCTLLGGAATAQAGAARPDLQPLLDQITANNAATAALAEFREGRTVWRGSSGVAQLGSPRPAPADGRFRAASVTKTFVATVVLQFVAEGKAGLDDTLAQRLPGLVPRSERITLRHLLQHTSGIANYTDFLYSDVDDLLRKRFRTYTPGELIALAADKPPLFEPGTSWSYSNTNYILLALVIERLTGKSFESAVTTRILRPLGMHSSELPGARPFIRGPHAHGYFPIERNGQIHPFDITVFNPTAPWAAGALISSTADLNRFYGALLGGRLLPPAQLREMLGNPMGPDNDYGLGILRLDLPCGTTIWGHTGGIFGYSTYAMSTQDGRRQLTLSVNPWIGDGGDAVLKFVFTAFCGPAPDMDAKVKEWGVSGAGLLRPYQVGSL